MKTQRGKIKWNAVWLGILGVFLLITAMGYKPFSSAASDQFGQSFLISYRLKTKAPVNSVKIINIYPHDVHAFTQGLFFHEGFLYESTGLNGKSYLAQKSLKTGKTLQSVRMSKEYFGEGAAFLRGKIYQLTWKNEILIIYEFRSMKEIKRIKYRGEGWGLATDGKYLLMSNGSPIISFRDPISFRIIRNIQVMDGDVPIAGINELEFIQGEIWANIFMEDFVVRISPQNGKVLGWIDLSILRSYLGQNDQIDVINGIAHDPQTGRIFVTGKYWPKIFEIRLLK